MAALTLAACAGQGVQSANTCFTVGLSQVSNNGELMVAAGRTFAFLGKDFVDLGEWRPDDALRICEYLEPHLGAPMFMVTNKRRNETLVVSERNGEQ